MNMLIDTLSADDDVMVYNSDPYISKIKSGGTLAGMNLTIPNVFLHQLYVNLSGSLEKIFNVVRY